MFRLLTFVSVFVFAASAQAGWLFHRHAGGCADGHCSAPTACAPATTAPLPTIPPPPAVCASPAASGAVSAAEASGKPLRKLGKAIVGHGRRKTRRAARHGG